MSKSAIVIWGTQLLAPHKHSALLYDADVPVFMIESRSLCRSHRFHKQKIAFVLTAMREYAAELRDHGRDVEYVRCDETDNSWFESLQMLCNRHQVSELIVMRQNDRTPQQRLEEWADRHTISLRITPNTMFLTPSSLFMDWAEGRKVLQMETFYRWQRKRLGILVENDKPVGGAWNFDHDNRKPLPKNIVVPAIELPVPSPYRSDVLRLIDAHFADHPGSYETSWLPTSRKQAKAWFDDFLQYRFGQFGDFEDAMKPDEPFLFHSAISALLNIGLLHPQEVVERALSAEAPLASKEGFIRQIIGWREFMFGLYHHKPMSWKSDNKLEHTRKLEDWWWSLDADAAPEPPLQHVIHRLNTYGYSHHIERLMVLGNYMLLSRYNPQEVYDWFMAMYVDAYEWVMVPNVIGMSQYADGGLDEGGFATKPYISGSNYLQKMGKWWPTGAVAKASPWSDMYWDFLAHHKSRLSRNHRLAPLLKKLK